MQIGDLVSVGLDRWVVESQRDTWFVLRSWDGRTQEVAPRDNRVRPVAHPPTSWPFIVASVKAKDGPIVKLTLARAGKVWLLEPLIDWVPSDRMRSGGSIFINPTVKLKIGEIVIVHHTSGKSARITIGPGFGSVAQRVARVAKAEPEPVGSIHDRLNREMLDDE